MPVIMPVLTSFKKTYLEKNVNLLKFFLLKVFKHLLERDVLELLRPTDLS
jgi:hypothetical protein